jgi:predicted nucleic acid-binding protein
MMQRIVDAAPLILLAKIDALELLRVGAEKVFAPSEVLLEVEQGADAAADKVRAVRAQWLLECQAQAPLPFTREALGAGERALLEQALALGDVQMVSDDLAARRAALQLGLKPIGTLGVLLVAKHSGVIEAVAPYLDALRARECICLRRWCSVCW